jgi:hypothetical protein
MICVLTSFGIQHDLKYLILKLSSLPSRSDNRESTVIAFTVGSKI